METPPNSSVTPYVPPMPVNFELIKVLAELIRCELSIPRLPQAVSIYNQKWRIPNTDGLFINIDFLGEKLFAANTRWENDPTSDGLFEQQYSCQQETYQVDVYSRDNSARMRKQEVVFALQSTRAQQLAEKYAFKIGHLPSSFVDLSEIEGAARLNRYALTFNVLRSYARTRLIEAFTEFTNPPELIAKP